MINLRITQRSIVIDKKQIIADVQHILTLVHYDDYDLGIWITTDTTIAAYNREYRHIDKPTDILSFPYHATLKAGERIKPKNFDDKNLGDLILSAAYIAKEAARYQITFMQRLRHLLVHGICHLLGYDHLQDNDYRRMRAKEGYILKKLATLDPV